MLVLCAQNQEVAGPETFLIAVTKYPMKETNGFLFDSSSEGVVHRGREGMTVGT